MYLLKAERNEFVIVVNHNNTKRTMAGILNALKTDPPALLVNEETSLKYKAITIIAE